MSHLWQCALAHPYIQYQSPETVSNKGFIFLKMLNSRPLAWSKGTDYNPYYNDKNQIAICTDLSDTDDREIYESLVRWIDGNIALEARALTSQMAIQKWAELSG
jgi:hypothetical protein